MNILNQFNQNKNVLKDNDLYLSSAFLGKVLKKGNKFVTCAESCTGGWLTKVLTDIPGSTSWFDRGFITYGNQAKIDLLGVQITTLLRYGAVSEPVVLEMANGALKAANADYAIAISGIAGPNGGTVEQPVGTVWFGFAALEIDPFSHMMNFNGNREAVRRQAVYFSLTTLYREVSIRLN